MLVGHFPSLPRILHLLVTGRTDGGAHPFPLHGLVQLRAAGDRWAIEWESDEPVKAKRPARLGSVERTA